MDSMMNVRWKIARVKQHFDELVKNLDDYYQSSPGAMVESPDSTPVDRQFMFGNNEPVPARIGLIFGDCLQNLRSSLDYLVWELVIAAGNEPTDRNMFPVSLTTKAYKKAIERGQLVGISEAALAHIDALQPFMASDPQEHPLTILDSLTNINKHRRPLFTELVGYPVEPPPWFRHLHRTLLRRAPDGTVIESIPIWAYVALQEGAVKGMEVTMCVDSLFRYVGDVVLPIFDVFLKRT